MFGPVTHARCLQVIYGKSDFLTVVNKHGVSPLVYLKALHAAEWGNFLERLGVKNEAEVSARVAHVSIYYNCCCEHAAIQF